MIGLKDRYALITGASSGIGYELAKLLARDGKNLVIVARSENRLEQVKAEIVSKYAIKIKVLPKDLTDPKAPLAIFSELEDEDIYVDILVNNAGFGVFGLFIDTDLEKELEMVQLHVSSLTRMTKLFLKRMLENKSGWILNVASALSFLPVPLFSVYAASKAYVLHLSEALANELRGTGVSVTCLCPPPTETAFHHRGNVENSKTAKGMMLDATTVAEVGYKALKKGKVIATLGLKGRSLAILARIAPRNMLTKMMRAMV